MPILLGVYGLTARTGSNGGHVQPGPPYQGPGGTLVASKTPQLGVVPETAGIDSTGLASTRPWALAGRIPLLYAAGRERGVWFRSPGSIQFRDIWGGVPVEECLDSSATCNEGSSQLRKRRVADNDKQGNVVRHDRSKLVWLVPNPFVMSDGYPPSLTNDAQPVLVGSRSTEVR